MRKLVYLVAFVFALGFGGLALADDPPEEPVPVPTVHTGDADIHSAESIDNTDQSVSDQLADAAPFEIWEILLGVALSGIVIPIFIQKGWSVEEQKATAFALAALAAIGGSYLRGELDNFTFTAASVLKMAGAVYIAYNTVWKVKFLSAIPAKIEEATGGDPANEMQFALARGYTNDPAKAGVPRRDNV